MLKFKDLMERINETCHIYEEVEDLEEANENFDSNSKAHQAAKKAVKGWRGNSKATYHSDGSATIHTKETMKNRYGKGGHYSGLETTHSHSVVDQHLKYAGGEHGHSRDDLDNHHQKIDGLHWKVKGKSRSHEIHIHEGVEGIQELSTDTLRKYRAKAKDDAYDAADVDDDRRLRKRSMGSWDAGKKILKRGDKLRAEEVEQTDEELKGNQHKIDANKNGKVDGHDFKILRNAKKARYQ
jgi:hypothetical protein